MKQTKRKSMSRNGLLAWHVGNRLLMASVLIGWLWLMIWWAMQPVFIG